MISEITSGKSLEITILVVASSLAILFYIWRKTTSRLPPGPFGLPVLGYLPFLGKELHSDFATLAKRFGPIYTLQLGRRTCIIVNSSDVANVVVHEQDDTFANRAPPLVGLLLTYGGKNITWSDNNLYWRNMRKVLVYEVMSNKNMEASLSFREGGVRKTIKNVYDSLGTEVCIGDIAFETSLAVTTSLIWGKSLNQNLGGVAFRDVIVKIVDLVGLPNISDFFPMLARFDLQGVQGKMYEQVHKLDEILEKIIEDRMSVKSQESKDGKMDFLQILLDLRQKNSYTIPQIKALLVDIFLAGTDTSSGMTEWTMAEVLTYPEVMKKIREELEHVVGLKNIVQESHLPKLRYLDAVIKETFRLHPPLPLLIGRSPSKPCKVGEYIVPKGSTIYMNSWAIHRDPKYWENPLEFNPNRFINPDGTTKFNYNGSNTNFVPFGSGRRICPGIPVGEKMLMYLLASLIHSFDWTLPNPKEHDLSDKFGIILRKRNPLIAIPSQRLADKSLYM